MAGLVIDEVVYLADILIVELGELLRVARHAGGDDRVIKVIVHTARLRFNIFNCTTNRLPWESI